MICCLDGMKRRMPQVCLSYETLAKMFKRLKIGLKLPPLVTCRSPDQWRWKRRASSLETESQRTTSYQGDLVTIGTLWTFRPTVEAWIRTTEPNQTPSSPKRCWKTPRFTPAGQTDTPRDWSGLTPITTATTTHRTSPATRPSSRRKTAPAVTRLTLIFAFRYYKKMMMIKLFFKCIYYW